MKLVISDKMYVKVRRSDGERCVCVCVCVCARAARVCVLK